MSEIFGQNLFEKNELLQTYKELLGVSEIKPLDCVGTPEEVKIAFYLAMRRREYEDTVAMKFFQKDVLPTISYIELLKEEVFLHSEKNNIPEEFK